ncbi:hypothetical protein [Pseudomonas sp. NPDC089569]|uniref:hypothetical protein n=1 Tax=Pseudomonas sp. NPDC089569 TaxID=3390722 RepID=UPI003CFF9631
MLIREFLVIFLTDVLTFTTSVVYAALFVGIINYFVPLEGTLLKVVAGSVFAVFFYVDYRYCSPTMIAIFLGRPIDFKSQSMKVIYFGVFSGAAYVSAILVFAIIDVVALSELEFLLVCGVVFFFVFCVILFYVKWLRRDICE